MPLTLNANIATTRIDRSKNPRLRRVLQYVQQYNSLPPTADTNLKIDLLHVITREAGDYFTSKPPQLSWKNQGRWDGLRELLEQIGPEMQKCGARGLTGPTDWKQIDRNQRSYWLELLDPQHRAGFKLSPRFQTWLHDPTARRLKQSFWVYMDGEGAGTAPSPELKSGVSYFPETNQASKHQMTMGEDGRLYDSRGDAFTSRDQTTVTSGDGWAIWVCSPTGELYCGSHVEGKLHHSSFLGGRPVMAAGEMVVDEDGQICVITAKSGHYIPSSEDLLRFVRAFPQIPGSAVILPDLVMLYQDPRVALFYFVSDFRTSGDGARPLTKTEVLNVVPSWARTNKADTTFDKIPAAPSGRMGRQLGVPREHRPGPPAQAAPAQPDTEYQRSPL